MAATIYDFTIEQGSDFKIVFQHVDEAGNNIDLTNWCVILQWKTNTDDVYLFSNRSNSNDYSLTTDSSGKITLQIPARITVAYEFDSAVYDLDLQETTEQYFNSGLKTYRLVTGGISILKRNVPINLQPCFSNTNDSTSLINSCNIICSQNDIYSIPYNGGPISIIDNAISSGIINTSDSRPLENVEIILDGLTHSHVQDLSFILAPPSGNKILLSANSKITNYRPEFICGFSNKAEPNKYIHNIPHGGLCNILNKTNIVKYNNDTLIASLDHLFGYSITGDWTLIIRDSDIGSSGQLNNWKLILTYTE